MKGVGDFRFRFGCGFGFFCSVSIGEIFLYFIVIFFVILLFALGMEFVLGVIRGMILGGGMRLVGVAVLKRGILEVVVGGDLGSDWG